MLCNCPECGLMVSDKAIACPHCGFPLQPNENKTRKTKKRMRLPNGFGQITMIKNRNLRKPYRAMISVGKDEYGKPICKLLKPNAYFKTYNDAYAALLEYNKHPYELAPDTTVNDLFTRFVENRVKHKKDVKWIKGCWPYCDEIKSMKVSDIRIQHLRGCLENGVNKRGNQASESKKDTIKCMLNMLFDYALEYELCDKNYARLFSIDRDGDYTNASADGAHIPFSELEMQILWLNINRPGVDLILIQCYSGWRPSELLELTLENINLEEGFMYGGKKTQSGKNRTVPIHSKILPLIKTRMDIAREKGSDTICYHFNRKTEKYQYDTDYQQYMRMFYNLVKTLGLNPEHKPHDGRVHFATLAKKYNVNEYAIKHIIGHSISDLTEKVYTKRDPKWLKQEIEKIKGDA